MDINSIYEIDIAPNSILLLFVPCICFDQSKRIILFLCLMVLITRLFMIFNRNLGIYRKKRIKSMKEKGYGHTVIKSLASILKKELIEP